MSDLEHVIQTNTAFKVEDSSDVQKWSSKDEITCEIICDSRVVVFSSLDLTNHIVSCATSPIQAKAWKTVEMIGEEMIDPEGAAE